MTRHFAWLAFACTVGCSPSGSTPAHAKEAPPMTSRNDKVTHTDAEWKKLLTPEQYKVLREKGTERPFSSPLSNAHVHAVYKCAGRSEERRVGKECRARWAADD